MTAHVVRCAACAATVEVEKFSLKHTSIQWSSGALRACERLGEESPDGHARGLVDSCTALRDSIEHDPGVLAEVATLD